MAAPKNHDDDTDTGSGKGTAVLEAAEARARPAARQLPPWRVLLHNDEVNDMLYVVDAIVELTTLNRHDAVLRMLEAHNAGLAMLLSTHREHAELLKEQFTSKRLTVTIEPE